MKATALRLENGKFMRGNTEVPVEIGNREQIELLQKYERQQLRYEEEAKKGLEVDLSVENISYSLVCSFQCVCSYKISDFDPCFADDYEELECPEWEGGLVTCPKCGRTYEIDGEYAKLH